MTEDQPELRIRRILVALDTSPHSRAALQAAVHLAKLSEAELKGLFVSDATWHQIGRLSLMSEVSEITGERRSFDEDEIERQCKLMENRLRHLIKSIAQKSNISYSLDSVRGSIDEELLKASEEADMITIGRTGHSHKQESKLGQTAQTIINKAQKPVLILEEGLSIGNQPIICVYDGTEQSQRGLQLALDLAQKNKNQLLVLGLANQSQSIQNRNKEIERQVQNAQVPVRLHLLKQNNIWNFTQLVNQLSGSLLIIPKSQPLVKQEWAGRIFNMAKCPLLLMT